MHLSVSYWVPVISNLKLSRMAEKYTLNWHTFSEHLQLMFKDLYEEDKYSDVTLVCDDQSSQDCSQCL